MEDEDDGWVDPMASLFIIDNTNTNTSRSRSRSGNRNLPTARTTTANNNNSSSSSFTPGSTKTVMTTTTMMMPSPAASLPPFWHSSSSSSSTSFPPQQQQQQQSIAMDHHLFLGAFGNPPPDIPTPPSTPLRNPFLDQQGSLLVTEEDHPDPNSDFFVVGESAINDSNRSSFSAPSASDLINRSSSSSSSSSNRRQQHGHHGGPKPNVVYHHSSSLSEGSSSSSFGGRGHLRLSASTTPHPGASRNLSLSFIEDLCRENSSSTTSGFRGPLPEFVGSRGEGIFQPPPRAALHPGRPPSLEVRPHPLRETQSGSFLRTIACCCLTPTQLWAGQESGLRFWDLNRLFSERDPTTTSRPPRGDDETAPFRESVRTSPTLCLAVDSASSLIWSGHKDGKIRTWSMNQPPDCSSNRSSLDSTASSDCPLAPPRFHEDFSWQAHRGPILSMVFTSYGDLWTGFEGGIIKIWCWESLEKSLCASAEERHVAALALERSYVDLRDQVTVVGVCPVPSSDVKFLLSDSSRSKVWSGSSTSFTLWNSRTRELLKVFDLDGQVEGRLDISATHLPYIEDEMKVKFVSTSKKEKTQGPIRFFQRSRNALMGAADVVRRVATKGTFLDDNRRTEAMAVTMDGMIWTGCANGALLQWNGNGNRLQEFQYHSSSVQCLCSFGMRLWVGYTSGTIQILDLEGILLGEWVAHTSPIIKMAVSFGYIFTLANHGGIRGWNLASPGSFDETLRLELTRKEYLFTKVENIKILVGTWNVGQERASYDSLASWVGSTASRADVVVVGLQEVEMGAGFLAMAAAKETVGLEGSANGQWWLDTLGKTLDEGTTFERVGSRQLAGLLICAWARRRLRRYIGDIDAGAIPCGFGRALGNKGSVGLKMRVYDRVLCFMNCHFAAHLEAVNRRNADFEHVYRSMSFSKPSSGYHSAGAGSSPGFQLLPVSNSTGSQYEGGKPELCEADMVVFLGDLNYRLHGVSYDEARESISQRSFDWLREKDQLRAEMKAGRVFQGLREGIIRFPPTYKFEKHKIGLSGYDSGEKKRVPAWCDRILYRDSRSVAGEEYALDCPTDSEKECSLRCPVISSISQYDACMDITDSDHKPVRCLFNVDIARVDELVRRQEFGRILPSNRDIRSISQQLSCIPDVVVRTNNIILQNRGSSIVHISNKCNKVNAMFEIRCEGESSIKQDCFASEQHPRCAFGFPRWLEVNPAAGIIHPGQIAEVCIHHEDFHTSEEYVDGVPQNWWCEDSRDKETTLVVNVRGSFSTESKRHLIHVQCCFSSEPRKSNIGITPGKSHSNLIRRADRQTFGHSTDADNLRRFTGP